MHKLPATLLSAIDSARAEQEDPLALFIYDLAALQRHVRTVTAALPAGVELYYAIKANSEPEILTTLAPLVDGFEISSGGEIGRLQRCSGAKPFIFSGPGKLDSELLAALQQEVEAIHVESLSEIERLQRLARRLNRTQAVFIRINPELPPEFSSRLRMAGTATPFGIDESELAQAVAQVDSASHLVLKGFHVHALSHQQDAERHQRLIDLYLQRWPVWTALSAHPETITHLNVGGGIGVNYLDEQQFDWPGFCAWLDRRLAAETHPPLLRFEPGRFISAFCGYYVIEVLDKKISHGERFLICRGGTHQFRLPVAQGHDHPAIHLPRHERPDAPQQAWTLVGQLCTPKDVLSRRCLLGTVEVGDILVLPLAGAYGYNISHADFLCHPRPQLVYLPTQEERSPSRCAC